MGMNHSLHVKCMMHFVMRKFITGGQMRNHPGRNGRKYMINIFKSSSPIGQRIEDFSVCSEKYYLHADPVIETTVHI